jgi:hypothetical protein
MVKRRIARQLLGTLVAVLADDSSHLRAGPVAAIAQQPFNSLANLDEFVV